MQFDLNQPTAALRVIRARIFDNGGVPLSLAHVFVLHELKIIMPDNTIADASSLPTPVAGAADGTFDIQISQAEISVQVGAYRWQLSGASYTFQEWIADVRLPMVASTLFAAIIEGVNQIDGGGEAGGQNVTFVQAMREILAYASHNATGLDGANPVYKSRGAGAPASGARNRMVATIVNGNRTVTSRDNT